MNTHRGPLLAVVGLHWSSIGSMHHILKQYNGESRFDVYGISYGTMLGRTDLGLSLVCMMIELQRSP